MIPDRPDIRNMTPTTDSVTTNKHNFDYGGTQWVLKAHVVIQNRRYTINDT